MSMKTRLVALPFLFWLAALLVGSPALAQSETPQTDGQQYFPETGHWISGDFLATYLDATDPVAIYGYPITDAFQNPTTGRIVQYFENAFFELYPESDPPLRVRRALLGEYLYQRGQSLSIPPNSPGCRYFPETRHQVCYAFLNYFEQNGGIPQFGYPISEIEIRNDSLVQYFQRAAFIWRPDRPSGERVVLSDLGRQYFDYREEDTIRLLPSRDRFLPLIILGLKLRAFPLQAVAPRGADQTLYVAVQDQNLRPVANATVFVTITYPSGRQEAILFPELTDEHGITRLTFRVDDDEVGLAEIEVKASFDSFQADTVTSFRIWW